MKMRRHKVSKKRSRRKFNKHARKTKAGNLRSGPMRGGIRM